VPRFVIGPVESFPPGTRHRVEVDGRGIAIFNDGGRFFALRDVCPHMGAPLSAGTVWRLLHPKGGGGYEVSSDRKVVKCPWHGWEYELATGQSWYRPDTDRVRAYEVSVEHGSELVDDEAEPAGLAPGPYVAETFPISVDGDYVVIEL
jgi:3-phenylpropionate/trans-cinnamate dioxygenase ferredoxin subunit